VKKFVWQPNKLQTNYRHTVKQIIKQIPSYSGLPRQHFCKRTPTNTRHGAKVVSDLDDSIRSSYAFNYACDSLHKDFDQLYLMSVCKDHSRVFPGYAPYHTCRKLEKAAEDKARKILVHYTKKASDANIKSIMVMGIDDNTGSFICNFASDYAIDHIVLGHSGNHAVKHLVLGSTSKFCVVHAHCNVIIVKPPVESDLIKTNS